MGGSTTTTTIRNPSGPVYYDAHNIRKILFQLHGSIWLQVLPYCLMNVAVMLTLQVVATHVPDDHNFANLVGESSLAHTFGGLIVSFLLVTRINSALERYFEYRQYISVMIRSTEEIIQKAIVFSQGEESDDNCDCCQYEYKYNATKKHEEVQSEDGEKEQNMDGTTTSAIYMEDPVNRNKNKAAAAAAATTNKNKNKTSDAIWRTEIAYRTLLLFRTTATNIEFPSTKIPAYTVKELTGFEREFVQPHYRFMKYHSIPQSTALNSFRVPLKLEQLLRATISSQGRRLSQPMDSNDQIHLQTCVDQFMEGFYGIRKFMTTQIPFPLVQMAHTMDLLFVYTLPFAFLKAEANLYMNCLNIFLLTYGFFGLMLVSIMLDDPFGNDPNDFNVTAYARFAMDDALIMVYDIDGNEWANTLQRKMGEDVGAVVSSSSQLANNNNNKSAPASTQYLTNENACYATAGTDEESALLLQSVRSVRMADDSATLPNWMIESGRYTVSS